MKIDGYTPQEWVEDESLELVIEDADGNKVSFKEHFIRGEPDWPPLEANGENWWIETREV